MSYTRIIMVAFHSFVSEVHVWPFDRFCVCLFCVIFIHVHPITLYLFWDIFLKLHKNVYLVKTMCRIQDWLFPLSWFLSYASLTIVKNLIRTITQ